MDGPQFPHEIGDLIVPLGERLVEVLQDGVAPLLVPVADGDADGFQIKAILTVILLGQREDDVPEVVVVDVAEQQ